MMATYKKKKATQKDVNKAYAAYKKRLKGLKKNVKNPNIMSKSLFMSTNFPKVQDTSKEGQLRRAGMSYKEIQRLKGKG
jgi:hypothetical protein